MLRAFELFAGFFRCPGKSLIGDAPMPPDLLRYTIRYSYRFCGIIPAEANAGVKV